MSLVYYFFGGHSVDAVHALCAQLTNDLFAIAKFLLIRFKIVYHLVFLKYENKN